MTPPTGSPYQALYEPAPAMRMDLLADEARALLGVIRAAIEGGKTVDVFADETRPFLQGARLTVWEFVEVAGKLFAYCTEHTQAADQAPSRGAAVAGGGVDNGAE